MDSRVEAWLSQAQAGSSSVTDRRVVESVCIKSDDVIDKALQYLDLWKYFMISKVGTEPVAETRSYSPPVLLGDMKEDGYLVIQLYYPQKSIT